MNSNYSRAFDPALFKDQDVCVANIEASCDGQIAPSVSEVDMYGTVGVGVNQSARPVSHQLVTLSVARYQPLANDGVKPDLAGGMADLHSVYEPTQVGDQTDPLDLTEASTSESSGTSWTGVSMVSGIPTNDSSIDTTSESPIEEGVSACDVLGQPRVHMYVGSTQQESQEGWTLVGCRRRPPSWVKRADDLDNRSVLLWGVSPAVTCLAVHQLIISVNLGRFVHKVEPLRLADSRGIRVVCHRASNRDVLVILLSPVVACYNWHVVKCWSYQCRQQARQAKQVSKSPSTISATVSQATQDTVLSDMEGVPSSYLSEHSRNTSVTGTSVSSICTAATSGHRNRSSQGRNKCSRPAAPVSVSDLASPNVYQVLRPAEKLVLGNFNCNRGLFRNKEEIGDFVRWSVKADILAVSETGLPGKKSISVPGYQWYGHNSLVKNYGGIGMLVKQHLVPYVSVLSSGINQYWLSFSSSEEGRRPLALCSVYMPPAGYPSEVRKNAFSELSSSVRKYQSKYDVVVMGDFNARVGRPKTEAEQGYIGLYGEPLKVRNPNGQLFMDLLQSNNLVSMNGRSGRATDGGRQVPYTRIEATKNEKSIIDYICVSRSLYHQCGPHQVDSTQLGGSDHKLNHLTVYGFSKVQKPKPVRVEKFRLEKLYKPEGIEEYQQQVVAKLGRWSPAGVSSSIQDGPQQLVDSVWGSWSSLVLSAAVSSIGKKLVVKGHARPELDRQVKDLIEQRRKIYREFSDASGSKRVELWSQYASLRKQVHALMHDKQTAKWSELMAQLEGEFVDRGNMKQFWSSVNRLATSKNRQVRSIGPILDDASGKVVVDGKSIQSVFAKFFEELGADKVEVGKFDQSFKELIDDQINSQSLVSDAAGPSGACPFSVDDLVSVLVSLKNGKSSGPDGIPNELLKYGGKSLEESYVGMLQFFYSQSCLPRQWDRSRIVVLPKPGDSRLCNNYRGISLMSTSAKVHAKLVSHQGLKGIPIQEEQAGFRAEYSCMDQVLILYETLRTKKLAGKNSFCFFIDVKKAFDTVWRNGLWSKLQEYGVDAKLWQMLRVMYRQVESCVVIDGVDSPYFPIHKGVRQGCTASPALFIVFFNDLCKELNSSGLGIAMVGRVISALLFADDVVLLSDSASGLKALMAIVQAFFVKWRLEENIAKSHVLQVQGARQTLKQVQYQFNGQPVKIVEEYKYLGVVIHQSLSWDSHIKQLVSRVELAQNNISHVLANRKLSIRVRKFYWLSVIRPILDYGSEVVRPTDSWYNRLETVQNVAMSLILGCNVHTNIWAMRAELGMQSIRSRYDQAKLIYYVKVLSMPSFRLVRQILKEQNPDHPTTFKNYVRKLAKKSYQLKFPEVNNVQGWAEQVKQTVAKNQACQFLSAAQKSSRMKVLGIIKAHNSLVSPARSVNSGPSPSPSPLFLERWLEDGRAKSSRLKLKFRLGTTSLHCDLVKIKSKSSKSSQVQSGVCKCCSTGAIEDRAHFLLHCPSYQVLRQSFMQCVRQCDPVLYQQLASGSTEEDQQKLALVLNLEQVSGSVRVANQFNLYLCQSWYVRSSLLTKINGLESSHQVALSSSHLAQVALAAQQFVVQSRKCQAQQPLPQVEGRPSENVVDYDLSQVEGRIQPSSSSADFRLPGTQLRLYDIVPPVASKILPVCDVLDQTLPAAAQAQNFIVADAGVGVHHGCGEPARGQTFDSSSINPCDKQVESMGLRLRHI